MMNFILLFLTHAYTGLLRLYPARFRREFSNEMRSVFIEMAQEAAEEGFVPLLVVCLRELGHLPRSLFLEAWHEGFNPQMAFRAVQEGYRGTVLKTGWADVGSWQAAVAGLLPIWLLSFAMATGWSQMCILTELACIAFWLAPIVGLVLIWKGWMTVEVLLYSLFPILLAFYVDETSATYRIPLYLVCTVFLSIGIIGYHYGLNRDKIGFAWLILLLVFIATWVFVIHANQNYWRMAVDLGYNACDNDGCVPLTPKGPAWQSLFFRVISGY
jgi:hypothetical protein